MGALDHLIPDLYHPDPAARGKSEAEIVAMGISALEPLIAVLNGWYPPPKPRRVSELFGLTPSPEQLVAQARARAAALLGQLGHPQADEALHKATHETDPELSHAAALALGRRRDGRAARTLLDALHSLDSVTRASAAELLADLGEGRAVAPLIHMMQTDGQPIPRWKAIRALGRLGDRAAVRPILGMLEGLLSLPSVDWAPPAHNSYGDEESDQVLWTTCTYAFEALEALGDPQAVPVLERLAAEAPARTVAGRARNAADRLRQAGA
jgi:HEAT repeat protein